MSIQLKQAESNYDERPQTYYFKKNFLLPLPKWNTLLHHSLEKKQCLLSFLASKEKISWHQFYIVFDNLLTRDFPNNASYHSSGERYYSCTTKKYKLMCPDSDLLDYLLACWGLVTMSPNACPVLFSTLNHTNSICLKETLLRKAI